MWSAMTLYDDSRKTTLKIKNIIPATDTQHGHLILICQSDSTDNRQRVYLRLSIQESHEHILCRRREMRKICSPNGTIVRKEKLSAFAAKRFGTDL